MLSGKYLKLIVAACLILASLTLLFVSSCASSPASSTAPQTSAVAQQTTSAAPQAAKVVELKYAYEQPLDAPISQQTVVPWAKDIEKATNGRVKITIYPGESLGACDTYLDGVKSGMFDMAWSSVDYYPGQFDLGQVLYYPIGIQTAGTGTYVYWDLYNTVPEVKQEYNGVKVLSLESSDGYDMFIGKKYGKDITTLSGFQNVLSKAGGGILNEMVASLGAKPVTVRAPQQYEALQKGTIDVAYFPTSDAPGFNLQDVVRSITIVDGPPCYFMDIMNPASYAKMTPEDQKIFDSYVGKSLVDRYAKYYYKQHTASMEFF